MIYARCPVYQARVHPTTVAFYQGASHCNCGLCNSIVLHVREDTYCADKVQLEQEKYTLTQKRYYNITITEYTLQTTAAILIHHLNGSIFSSATKTAHRLFKNLFLSHKFIFEQLPIQLFSLYDQTAYKSAAKNAIFPRTKIFLLYNFAIKLTEREIIYILPCTLNWCTNAMHKRNYKLNVSNNQMTRHYVQGTFSKIKERSHLFV